jgi:PAS domain S-box-containing protein
VKIGYLHHKLGSAAAAVALMTVVGIALFGWLIVDEGNRRHSLDAGFAQLDSLRQSRAELIERYYRLRPTVADGPTAAIGDSLYRLTQEHAFARETAALTAFRNHLDRQPLIIGILIAVWLASCAVVCYGHAVLDRRRRRTEVTLRRSEQMLQLVLDTIPARVFWKDRDINYLGCNRLFAHDAGLTEPREIIGRNDYELAWKEQAELYRTDDAAVIRGENPKIGYEEPQTGPGGKKLWLRTTKIPLKDTEGNTIGVLGTYEDITERKRSEEALRESLQTSADIVASIPSGLFIYQYEPPDRLVLLDGNPEAESLTGLPIEHWRGREFNEVWNTAKSTGLTEAFLNVVKTGRTYVVESLSYKDNRLEGTFRIHAFRIQRDRLGVAFENITERTRVYEALRKSEERYRFLYKNLPIMLHAIDGEGRLVTVSNQWLETLGYQRAEVIGRKVIEFMTPESWQYARLLVMPQLLETGSCKDVLYQFVRKNGEVIDVLLSAVTERDKAGEAMRIVSILIDVTDLKTAQRRIVKLARAVEQSPSMVLITDAEGRIEYVNPRYIEATGFGQDELIGRTASVFRRENGEAHVHDEIRSTVSSGSTWTGTVQRRRKNGDVYWKRLAVSPIVDEAGRTANYLIIGEDITDEISVHHRLAESDKLSAIGLLAAGVAHEFKNHLCGILGNATLLLDDADCLRLNEDARHALAAIVDISERADGLATSLLTYSKAPSDHFQSEDLRQVVDRTVALVRQEMSVLGIDILTSFEPVPPVDGSGAKIQQLLLKLLTNAQHSIGADGLIMLSITGDDHGVTLKVTDTGKGIPPEILPHIYDPFFSTKGVWGNDDPAGLGLGLAICRNIAREHGGELGTDTIVGIGTVFTLTLPFSPGCQTSSAAGALRPAGRRFILSSDDITVIEHYFKAACKQRFDLCVAKKPTLITAAGRPEVDLVICDAAATDRTEMIAVMHACRAAALPVAVVHCGKADLPPTLSPDTGAVCFDGLPDLEQILQAVVHSEAQSAPQQAPGPSH